MYTFVSTKKYSKMDTQLVETTKYFLDIERTFFLEVAYTWKWENDFDGTEIIAVKLRSVSIFGIDLPTWQLPKDVSNSIRQSIQSKKALELLKI